MSDWHRELDGDWWVRVWSWQFWAWIIVASIVYDILKGAFWAWWGSQ